MRKRFFTIMALATAAMANAQPSISLTGGFHQSSISPGIIQQPNIASSVYTKRVAPHFGLMANVPFSTGSRFAFQPGVVYYAKGDKISLVMDSAKTDMRTATVTRNLNYIDIPLNVVYKLPLSRNTSFVIGGGPQASLFYNGQVQTSSVNAAGEYAINDNNDLPVGHGEGQYKIVHIAAGAVAGFEFGRLSLTAQYSHSLTDFYQQNGMAYKHTTVGASLGIKLGKAATPATTHMDTDGDGIADEVDNCPMLAGTALTHGCPDRDGDGVADAEDQCPDMAGVVAYKGCPAPDTNKAVAHEKVDSSSVAGITKDSLAPVAHMDTAATAKVTAAVRTIQFEFKKATLTPASYQTLDEAAALLQNDPSLKVSIEGHTSTEGLSAYNMALSQARANSVKQYLIRKGVAANRISAIGYGASKPLVVERSESDRQKNRRVELIWNN